MELGDKVGRKLKKWLNCSEAICAKYENDKLICSTSCESNRYGLDDHTCCFFCDKTSCWQTPSHKKTLPKGTDLTLQIMLFRMED